MERLQRGPPCRYHQHRLGLQRNDYDAFASFQHDATLRRWNLWSYIDARDAAQAVRRALAHRGAGADVFIIANADTVMARPSQELLAEVFPDVEVRGDIDGHGTLFSIDKARRVLGYEPQYTWRNDTDFD